MKQTIGNFEECDQTTLVKLVVDAFRRIVVHYGFWFAQVEHQLGLERALEVEDQVWGPDLANQMTRLGKILGFEVKDGLPTALTALPKEALLELLHNLAINWLANDGIWFQAVEGGQGMNDAKRCNDTCWTRFSPFEAARIKKVLGLPQRGGLEALKQALSFRLYALINSQSMEQPDEHTLLFYMNECRVQRARQRKGLPDYPCLSVGLVEYPYFARAIDDRIQTECLACPPQLRCPAPGSPGRMVLRLEVHDCKLIDTPPGGGTESTRRSNTWTSRPRRRPPAASRKNKKPPGPCWRPAWP